jgi:hypothetical protein
VGDLKIMENNRHYEINVLERVVDQEDRNGSLGASAPSAKSPDMHSTAFCNNKITAVKKARASAG